MKDFYSHIRTETKTKTKLHGHFPPEETNCEQDTNTSENEIECISINIW